MSAHSGRTGKGSVNCRYCSEPSVRSIQVRVGIPNPEPEKDKSSQEVIGFCNHHWRDLSDFLLQLELKARAV